MIHIQNLTFRYKKQEALFTDLSFEQQNGSIVGLLGKNGAGKSTLLQLISGLLQPQSGKLDINGFKPFDRLPDFLADIYMVSEEFSFPSITIGVYIKATAPLYPKFDSGKMNNILQEFELDAKKNLNKLSHGQRKKFLIAFALSTNCSLLILDEPTNGLDIPSKSLFRKVLVSSVTDEQLVLISTHQVKDIETIIDKLSIILSDMLINHLVAKPYSPEYICPFLKGNSSVLLSFLIKKLVNTLTNGFIIVLYFLENLNSKNKATDKAK